jgi:hypothetical protein
MDAIMKASTIISDAMRSPTVGAKPDMGIGAWLASDDTGSSSLFMASVLYKQAVNEYPLHISAKRYPLDPSDFGRCSRFLKAVPGSAERLAEVARAGGPVWLALVQQWAALEDLYQVELPFGSAPKLYARMKEIIAAAQAQSKAA